MLHQSSPMPTDARAQRAMEWANRVFPSGVSQQMHDYTASQLADIESEPRSKRQFEFAVGRECAHDALRMLGESEIVGISHDRSPKWPTNFAGSISHSDVRAWAAAIRQDELLSIGIDTETMVTPHSRTQLADEIATNAEWKIALAADHDPETAFTLVFSAKESYYKCWAPVTGEFFGFHDATIESMDFEKVTLLTASRNPNFGQRPKTLDVYYLVDGDSVFTATWIRVTDR